MQYRRVHSFTSSPPLIIGVSTQRTWLPLLRPFFGRPLHNHRPSPQARDWSTRLLATPGFKSSPTSRPIARASRRTRQTTAGSRYTAPPQRTIHTDRHPFGPCWPTRGLRRPTQPPPTLPPPPPSPAPWPRVVDSQRPCAFWPRLRPARSCPAVTG